jgi:hypothetical protein
VYSEHVCATVEAPLCRFFFAACNSVSKLLPIQVDIDTFRSTLRDAVDVIGARSPSGKRTAELARNETKLSEQKRMSYLAKHPTHAPKLSQKALEEQIKKLQAELEAMRAASVAAKGSAAKK